MHRNYTPISRGAVLLTLTAALAAPPSQGALSAWRSQVQVSTGSGVGTQFAFDGDVRIASSAQSLSNAGASSEASASLADEGYIPTLRTRATNSGTRAQAVAWGVQGYTNRGSVPLDTSLLLNLTANVSGANDLEGRVYLFQEQGFSWSFDPGTMLFESSSQLWPGFEAFANNPGPDGFDILIKNFDGAVNENRAFEFTVDPGESFYLWARLISTADNEGVVDAFSTLTASLGNTSGLTPAAIPEPTIPALVVLGFSILLGRSRPSPAAKSA